MALLGQFSTPAGIRDFPSDPRKQQVMDSLWSANVNRWVQIAQSGDVWASVNAGPRPAFYNPLVTHTPDGAATQAITWKAFPGRIQALFPDKPEQWHAWADDGQLPVMTIDLCTGQSIQPKPYTPTGPRGWQDEYCEWSVTRAPTGKITSIMFTCENPEYWFTLWQVDPEAVLSRYQELISPKVSMEDLVLHDSSGQPVIDPATGQAAYNPLNPWNWGTQTLLNQRGGAVHLTSTPNTLSAEIDLAAAATLPRTLPPNTPLICCAQFGRVGRHSDPTIGQNVNAIINDSGLQGAMATLTNPPGLYMQMPDFSQYETPDGTPASRFWTIVRGQARSSSGDIDRILHAVFAVPPSYGYTVSDIKINGESIRYGSQIVDTITMALSATAFASGRRNQDPMGCTAAKANPSPAAKALQGRSVFDAYRSIERIANEKALALPILSLPVQAGSSVSDVALLLNTREAPADASITVTESDNSPSQTVSVEVTGTTTVQDLPVLLVTITASSKAVPGDRGLVVSVPGMATSPTPALGLLNIVGAGALQE